MLFNSLHYFIFFPVVASLYFLSTQRLRWFLLLAASCYFYAVFVPAYLLILLVTISVDYASGLLIEHQTGGRRRLWLALSIGINVGMLAVFKYFDFFAANIDWLTRSWGGGFPLRLHLLLPIGLSFHTFQSLSYTIEVYRGRQKAERHFGIFALYVMFFPQLVAGPIERPQNLLRQFREEHRFDPQRAVEGLRLILWGLFKKVVIADRLAVTVDQVYSRAHEAGGFQAALAMYFFAFQIYCDFSGYSDIALGSAKVLGFRLMENFHRPYFAASISEFWRRWHISLSTWFRDYLYIPLGGSRVSLARRLAAVLVVFLVSGLWHGANWTFVIWGFVHALLLIAIIALGTHGQTTPPWRRLLAIVATFHLTCAAWVFFRAHDIRQAWTMLSHLTFPSNPAVLRRAPLDLFFDVALIGVLISAEALQEWRPRFASLAIKPGWARWAAYYAAALAIVFLGEFQARRFIYFQF